jgi:hypothetical protein
MREVPGIAASFAAADTLSSITAASGTANALQVAQLGTIEMSSVTSIAVCIAGCFWRDAALNSDTFTGKSAMVNAALYYRKDSLGSLAPFTK